MLAAGGWYRPRGFDVLRQDEADAVSAAAEHLIGLGVRRPAFLAAPTGGSAFARRDAFVSDFRRHGYAKDKITVAERHEDAFSGFLDARHLAAELLERPRRSRPDAIMANSDRAAISTMWAALQLGIAIPDDLKVIGAGNIPEGSELTPSLTTVGSEVEEYRPGLERLLARIDDPTIPTRTLAVTWRLILRGTA